ncbi:MAG: hypothetical protein E5299_00167 [Burkholderia gladioli]|nr:MAG: hypothetical protein E5299_00167 [Burkholderia gladioli]
MVSECIYKSYTVTVSLYRVVLLAQYRRAIFDDWVDELLKRICLEIVHRYQMKFLEIWKDKDHVHCLGSSISMHSV